MKLTKGGVFLTVYALIGIILFGVVYFIEFDRSVIDIAVRTYISSASVAMLVSDFMDGKKDMLRIAGLLGISMVMIYICIGII